MDGRSIRIGEPRTYTRDYSFFYVGGGCMVSLYQKV